MFVPETAHLVFSKPSAAFEAIATMFWMETPVLSCTQTLGQIQARNSFLGGLRHCVLLYFKPMNYAYYVTYYCLYHKVRLVGYTLSLTEVFWCQD